MLSQLPDYRAYLDPFCQLPNRTALRFEVQSALEGLDEGRHEAVSLVVIGLDSLKSINARYGMAMGDGYLYAWAQRLKRLGRDYGQAFYLFGSQFVLLLKGNQQLTGQSEATFLVQLQRKLQEPFDLAEKRLDVEVSMGVVCAPADGSDFDELMANGLAARNEAQDLGSDPIVYFSTDASVGARASELALASELSEAIDAGDFELHYQPIIDLRAGGLAGLEALIRWRHPERGLIPPAQFIPLAESTGLIHRLGPWILRQLNLDYQHWRELGGEALCVSLNVSPRELAEYGFVDRFDSSQGEYSRFEPPELELEITESLMVHHPERCARILRRLRGRGLRIAIDDFGSGYASLLYLKRFAVDRIKIDRQYVESVLGHRRDRAVVTAALQLARDLQAEAVAEGVETAEQMDALIELDCHLMQGYYFCRPKPIGEVWKWWCSEAGQPFIASRRQVLAEE